MAIEYVCKRCGYKTHIRKVYSNHLNKKYPCKTTISNVETSFLIDELNKYIKFNLKTGISIESGTNVEPNGTKVEPNGTKIKKIPDDVIQDKLKHQCGSCKKFFSRNSSLRRHEKGRCKRSGDKDKIVKLEKEIEQLKEENYSLVKTSIQPKNINSHNNITNTNNITLNSYGTEDFTYITQDLLKSFLSNPYESIPQLVGLIHFNPEHPENRNVKWTNVNQNFLQRYEWKQGWISRDKKEVIRDLNDQAYIAVDMEYDPETTKLNDSQKEYYEKFRKEYDTGIEKTIKRLEKQTERMIRDKRK